MTITQKDIARVLDRAAERADSLDYAPATSKQCWFLAKLILESEAAEGEYNNMLLNNSMTLTRREASAWIDSYIKH